MSEVSTVSSPDSKPSSKSARVWRGTMKYPSPASPSWLKAACQRRRWASMSQHASDREPRTFISRSIGTPLTLIATLLSLDRNTCGGPPPHSVSQQRV